MFCAARFTSLPFVRFTCLTLCFALVLSSVSFAVSGSKSKKKSGSGSPGSGSAAQRTQGPPSPNLPNLDEARKSKPGRPKAPPPVPATKCRHRDTKCKKAKGETAIIQPQFTDDRPDRLLARIDNHSLRSRFTASEKIAGRGFSIPAVDALLNKSNRAVLDSPVGRSHRPTHRLNPNSALAAAPGFMMQTDSDIAMAQLDPNNRKGTPGEDLLSRNFNWGLSLLSLPGRADLDLGLGISYNSLVWTRFGNTM